MDATSDSILTQSAARRPDPAFLEELFEAGAHLFALTAHDDQSVDLRARGKRPWRKGWNSPDAKPLSRKQAAGHMRAGRNTGERLRPTDLCVDIDPRNLADGKDYSDPERALKAAMAAWERFCGTFNIDPNSCPIYVTGSGGLHARLKKSASAAIVTRLDGWAGVEFKSAGTFVVAPGSLHAATGRLYEPWFLNLVRLKDAPLAPAALLDLLKRPALDTSAGGGGELEPEKLAELLAVLDSADFRDHGDWFSLMCAAHHATNGDGEDVFLAWSGQDPFYADATEINRTRWQSLRADKPRKTTVLTLYKAVCDAGRADLVAAIGGEKARKEAAGALAVEPLEGQLPDAKADAEKAPHRWHLWEVSELGKLPPIRWLVEQMMPERGLGQIYGPTKSYKTFASLAFTLSIATGKPFYGVSTQRGRVVYVVGEGQSDIYDRIAAWCRANDVSVESLRGWFRVVITPVLVDSKEVKAFANLVAQQAPFDLIVLDTVNRCMEGDENSTHEMTRFVKGCDHIREALKCAVLVVHHSGWNGNRVRGSSVLLSAVDVSIQVKMIDEAKSRDTQFWVEHIRAAAPDKKLFLTPHTVVTSDTDDELRSSIVLREIEEPLKVSAKDVKRMQKSLARDALLLEIIDTQPQKQKALIRDEPYRSQASVSDMVRDLRDEGLLEADSLKPTAEAIEYAEAVRNADPSPVKKETK